MPDIIEDTFSMNQVDVTIYRRAVGGNLYAYFRVGGERKRRSLETSILRDARKVARQHVQQAMSHSRVQPPKKAGLANAVREYLDAQWPPLSEADKKAGKADLRKGNRTYQDHKSRLNRFAALLPAADIGRATYDDVVAWVQKSIDARENGRSAVNDREVYRQFFKWLMSQRRVVWLVNPCASEVLMMPRLEETEPNPCSDDELKAFLPLAKKSAVWPVVVLCLGAGLRPAEALRLKWTDIDLEKGIASVENRKGSTTRKRKPALNAWVLAELKAAPRTADTVFPFNSFSAFDMVGRVQQISKEDAKAGKKPGSVTLQRLRQTACTRAILDGMPLADYVSQFGHSLAQAQRDYLRLDSAGTKKKHMEATSFGHFSG